MASAALIVVATACGAPADDSTAAAPVDPDRSTAAAVTAVPIVSSTPPAGADASADDGAPTTTMTADPTTTSSSTTTSTTSTTTASTTTTTTVPPVVERSGANVGTNGTNGEVGEPLAIRIPSIGVDSALVSTGVLDDGTVAVPPDANIAGWFNGGPRPGERGPAVIMGHVDSARTGPGVFYNLRNIQVGDVATVDTETGPHDFVVEQVEQHPKLEFPTADVYGPVPSPALRLVTCGGSFDRSVRSYYDNIIVYLVPVQS